MPKMTVRGALLAILLVTSAGLLACDDGPPYDAVRRAIRAPIGEATSHPEVCAIDSVGCSGTLVAPSVVLTAGHCISRQTAWRVRCPYSSDPAVVMAHEASSPPSWPRNVNPDSLDMNGGDDVALVHLDRALAETRFGKVNLGSFDTGSKVYAIGRVDDGKYGARFWISEPMTISGQDTARRYWVAVDFPVGQPGDSGGPLITMDTQEIVGVDSLGGRCGAQKLCEIFGMVGGDPAWFAATLTRFAANEGGGPDGGAGQAPGRDGGPAGAADAGDARGGPDAGLAPDAGVADRSLPAADTLPGVADTGAPPAGASASADAAPPAPPRVTAAGCRFAPPSGGGPPVALFAVAALIATRRRRPTGAASSRSRP